MEKRVTTKKSVKKAAKPQDIEALLQQMQELQARVEAAEQRADDLEDAEAKREAELDQKAKELFEKQQANRRDPELVKHLFKPRDPSIIRQLGESDFIRCIALRKIGINNDETSDIDEDLDVQKSLAGKLQDAGALKVKL